MKARLIIETMWLVGIVKLMTTKEIQKIFHVFLAAVASATGRLLLPAEVSLSLSELLLGCVVYLLMGIFFRTVNFANKLLERVLVECPRLLQKIVSNGSVVCGLEAFVPVIHFERPFVLIV